MEDTLEKAIEQASTKSPETQHILGQLLDSAINSQKLSPEEIERHYRNLHTLQGLEQAFGKEGFTLKESEAQMNDFLSTL